MVFLQVDDTREDCNVEVIFNKGRATSKAWKYVTSFKKEEKGSYTMCNSECVFYKGRKIKPISK
jgi:hypothetical protein